MHIYKKGLSWDAKSMQIEPVMQNLCIFATKYEPGIENLRMIASKDERGMQNLCIFTTDVT